MPRTPGVLHSDRATYAALHGGRFHRAPPAYLGDEPEALILVEIEEAFGRLDFEWSAKSDHVRVTVRKGRGARRQAICSVFGLTRTGALCAAARHLAAFHARTYRVPRIAPGRFYWFRPWPWHYFYPEDLRSLQGGEPPHGNPFAFATPTPFPVYVHRDLCHVRGAYRHVLAATGVCATADPVGWPENCDGAPIAVPLSRLPGDLGPRIEPPAGWSEPAPAAAAPSGQE